MGGHSMGKTYKEKDKRDTVNKRKQSRKLRDARKQVRVYREQSKNE